MEAAAINNDLAGAIEVIREHSPGFAVELLIDQGRWVEALEVLGVVDP